MYTLLFGKKVGEDNYGNKYYQNKNGSRWVIFKGEIDNNIPLLVFLDSSYKKILSILSLYFSKNHHILAKRIFLNQTGTDRAYNPNKNDNAIKKKYTTWKK